MDHKYGVLTGTPAGLQWQSIIRAPRQRFKRGRSVNNFTIRKAAVLGAGVMGAQIAAHLANADVPVVLFDLPAEVGSPNGIVHKAVAALAKLEPAPLAARDRVAYIKAANYGSELEQLRDCDLVIEAI